MTRGNAACVLRHIVVTAPQIGDALYHVVAHLGCVSQNLAALIIAEAAFFTRGRIQP